MKKPEIISRISCFQGFFNLETLRFRLPRFDGTLSAPLTREVFKMGPVVVVLPYDPVQDRLLLIEQFRIGAFTLNPDAAWMIEAIAGLVEDGEDKAEAARREATEEAGIHLTDLLSFGSVFSSPGAIAEEAYLFCGAADLSQAGGVHGLAEEGEDIRTHVLSVDDARRWLQDGRIQHGISALLLYQFLSRHAEIRQRFLGQA
jgi:ADP-ribose pyrophosphatase